MKIKKVVQVNLSMNHIVCIHEVTLDNDFECAIKVGINLIACDSYYGKLCYDRFKDTTVLRNQLLTISSHLNTIVEFMLLKHKCISRSSSNLIYN